MGGRGSGQYYRGSTRTACGETRRIDIRFMLKRGMLRTNSTGSLTWSRGNEPMGNIRYAMFYDQMRLDYRCRWYDEEWEDVKQTITIDRTPCNYGGTRKWFLCPNCNKRVAILYQVNTLFLCRHCYRLPYASQSENYLDRMSRKFDKLNKRLEADEYINDGDLWKPKGMHWRTFYHLKMAEIDADERSANAFLARFSHWL
jgi:hypothetical protein